MTVFFLKTGKNPGGRFVVEMEYRPNARSWGKNGRKRVREHKKDQIFTNVYQKFEDFKAKPFTKVIKICIMPEGSTVWASHIHMARRLTYTV